MIDIEFFENISYNKKYKYRGARFMKKFKSLLKPLNALCCKGFVGGGNRRLASLNCHTEDNSPKYRMIGNVVGLESPTYIFTDKVYSLFTTHHSLKRPGATHVALCNSVGSYFRHWCGAFTLAEVLITLGIIGVVAAMTMPSLMQNYKRQQATARIKKFVSVINQALISAENDLGPREDWVIGEMDNSDSAYNFLNTYIKPYIKSADIEKRTLFGRNMATLRFVDGSQMSVKVGACYDIWYDINGEKGPNEKGKDIFVFILCKNGGCNFNSNQVRGFYCAPTGEQFPTHEQLIDNCKNYRTDGGNWCTILLEQNGYEFPKDYPLSL